MSEPKTININLDFPMPTTEQVVEAMAARMLSEPQDWDPSDPDAPPPTDPRPYWDRKQIGKRLKAYLDEKIEEAVRSMVEAALDGAIKARIAEEVDRVLADGWVKTDEYGHPDVRAGKVTLKDRVNQALTRTANSSYDRRTQVDQLAADAIDRALKGPFGQEIEAARAKFKAEIDGLVAAKLNETIKSALGLR